MPDGAGEDAPGTGQVVVKVPLLTA